MEKGRIKIHKSGKVKKASKADGKGISVPGIFDFTSIAPENGTKEYDCEFELDDKGRVTKIWINGKEVSLNQGKLEEKEKKEKRKEDEKQFQENKKQEEKRRKSIIEKLSTDSVNLIDPFIPSDTIETLSTSYLSKEELFDNYYLKLNRLARYEYKEDKISFLIFKNGKYNIDFEPKPQFLKKLIEQISSKEQSNAKSIFKKEASFKVINFKPNWRIIVGLGGESVYETSITLHHIYGIPYIPASSIKGVVRSWIINSVFGDKDIPEDEKGFPLVNAEYRAYQDDTFCYTFGCPAEYEKVIFENGKPKTKKKNDKDVYVTKKVKTKLSKLWVEKNKKFTGHIGKIIFLDAFPTNEPKIEVDIMNVHYPDYYNDNNGKTAPTDTQNPNPIPFLTVAKTDFQFIIGSKKNELSEFVIDNKSITEWLKEALTVHGIGAKTAVGYGRLTNT